MRARTRRMLWATAALALAGGLGACSAPRYAPQLPAVHPPLLAGNQARMPDGIHLPLHRWGDAGEPRAVVLGLHGFNDYGRAFEPVGEFLAAHGVHTYAVDQRGFGAAPYRGLWAGAARLAADARTLLELLRARYPDVPLYLMGESMGGAVALLAQDAPVDGLILAAPAVWGRASMNPLQRALLWTLVRVAPGWRLRGTGLRITASDNVEMLQALHDDPLVIRATRVDAVHGMVDLMDAAAAAAPALRRPTLILYGARDEVIRPGPTCRFLEGLPTGGPWRLVFYPQGYHLLTRDLGARVVLEDVRAWLSAHQSPLPSGFELRARRWTEALC